MALTIGPLLTLPFAGMLIRRAGYRYDAWVFPLALGFHWLLIRGHGTEPLYLIAVTLFVLMAGGAAFAGLAGPREVQGKRKRKRRPHLSVVREPAPVVEAEPVAATQAPVLAPVPAPAPAAPVTEMETPCPVPVPQPTIAPQEERSIAPPMGAEELLERIDAVASEAQRVHLLSKLRSAEESVEMLRADAGTPLAALGHAWTTAAHAWGNERRDGLLVRFDGTAPEGSSILVVLCDVSDPAGLLDVSTREDLRGSALLVPTDLEGVKRLGAAGDGDSRWVARAVFVPLHLLVGEASRDGGGPGRGEKITGRPA